MILHHLFLFPDGLFNQLITHFINSVSGDLLLILLLEVGNIGSKVEVDSRATANCCCSTDIHAMGSLDYTLIDLNNYEEIHLK